MRPFSVSVIKGTRTPARQSAPRQGSNLRRVYDALASGKVMRVHANDRRQLEDFYGLDLVVDHLEPSSATGKGRKQKYWRMAG